MGFFKKDIPPFHKKPQPEYPGKLTGANVAGAFARCDDFESRRLARIR